MANVLIALVSSPILLQGAFLRSDLGIPLGRSISPLLANAYLTQMDSALEDSRWRYLRYADDIAIAAQTEQDLAIAEIQLSQHLSALRLSLREEKTSYLVFNGAPIIYLGHTVDTKCLYAKVASTIIKKAQTRSQNHCKNEEHLEPGTENGSIHGSLRHHTLYITEPSAYLKIRNNLIIIQRGKEKLYEVPLHRIDRVLVLTNVAMSSGFIFACISSHIPVLFWIKKGKAYGSLIAGGMPNPLRLRAQYDLMSSSYRRLQLAQTIVETKLRAMLRRLSNTFEASDSHKRIMSILDDVVVTETIDSLRGYEGIATKLYYIGMATRIKKGDFKFTGRSKRPPKDPINSLLSFTYSLIFGEMQIALLSHGLDPYPAVLHELNRGHPALASDLVEPYRILVADSFVLSLINNGQIALSDFEQFTSGGVFIKPDARRSVLAAYEAFMDRNMGGGKGNGTPRQLIEAAALRMLHVVLGETENLELPLCPSGNQVCEDELPL